MVKKFVFFLEDKGEKMGTRNLTMIYSNGEYKVAQYGQWDGYPEGLGVKLLNYLSQIKIDCLRNAVNKCTYLSKDDIAEINKSIKWRLADIFKKNYYPVKFVKAYELDNLPDKMTFVEEINEICGFDEE